MTLTRTLLNGRLPDSQLVVVDTGPNGPQRLHVTVAPLWRAMLAAGLPAGHLRSGYRTLAQQAEEVARTAAGIGAPSAATPGMSWHGEGFAADEDEPGRAWLRAYGAPYGVVLDTVPGEDWHMLIDPALATYTAHPTPTLEDDMKDSIIAIYLRVADKMPSPSELAYWQSEIALGRTNLATLERLLKADPNSAGDNSAKRNAAGSAWASR